MESYQGRLALNTETEAGATEDHYCLDPQAPMQLVTSVMPRRTLCPGMALPAVHWAILRQSAGEKMPHRHGHRQPKAIFS